jgi:hypothetical protein
MFSADIGGAAFSDFQRALARPAPGGPVTTAGLGDFRRRVSAQTTATLGASAAWWVRDGWAVRIGGTYAPTRFSVWNEPHAQRALDEFTSEEQAYAKLHTWTASATAVFRFPFTVGRLVPYGLAGGGLVGYRLADGEEVPPEARSRFRGGEWTGPAVVFGVGSAIPLQRYGLMLNFELTNHLSRTPLDEEGWGERFNIGGVPLDLASDPGRGREGIGITNHLRLTAGLTLPVRLGH